MNNDLHRSISPGNASTQRIQQGMAEAHASKPTDASNALDSPSDLALDLPTLQILDSSEDCIKVLDLNGRLLFMNRGGQALMGIADITPLLHTSWIGFWQESEQQAASDAIARAAAGEVCSLKSYCPTLDGEPKWWDHKISPIRGKDGTVDRVLCISRDITVRKSVEDEHQQTQSALQASEAQFRLLITASSNAVYKMSADWCELRILAGKDFLTSTQNPNQTWLEQYIPLPEQSRVTAAIAEAIRTKSTFELEHRVIQQDGGIGWAFSRAIPLLGPEGEIIEWLGAASDITVRKQAELSAEFLARVTQNLTEATCIEDIIQMVGEQLNHHLQSSICAFVEISEGADEAAIHYSWHEKDVPSLIGVYHLPEFVTDEFFQMARRGQVIIVRDINADLRIADPQRFVALNIGSFINVPLIRENEWKFTLGIYHRTAYNWRSDEIELMRELANRIWTKLERTRIEIALRQNQEIFSALVGDAPFGVHMIDAEFRFRQANQTSLRTFNAESLIGRDLAEVLRTIWQEPFATEVIDRFRHTLATGESFYSPPIIERRADIDEVQSYDWQIHRITLPDGSYGVVCYFYDLSEIKRAEEIIRRNGDRDAFLVTLNDALRPLTNATEILATANRVLGEQLRANRVTYFEVRGTDYLLEQDYVDGAESLRGRYPVESFGAALLAAYQRGHTATATDVTTEPNLSEAQRSAYADAQIAAYIGVPLLKQGDFVAGLAVHSSKPRHWTPEEIALTEDVAERTWAAVERARAEAALRASEAKYRGLFASLDEGYFLAEVIFDADDQPIDIFCLEANPAATRMVGQDFTGQRLREIAPYYEPYWYEIFGRVAQTGLGERLEQYAEPARKWYDFYVFKVSGDNGRRVSVVFKDITERKRREAHAAFLAELGEDFTRLSSASEIMQTVGAKIGAYLQITTCNFTDVDEAHDRVTVYHGWSSPEVPSTVGTFRTSQYLSKEFERASRAGETVVICNTQTDPRTDAASYAALNMYSFVTVPFHRYGRWTHFIAICHSQPRDWREDEIQLIEEISNRIFPRLQRARTEEALRESEAKYRSLFESMDQGFCLIKVLYDDNGKVFDFCFLETNPAFEKHTAIGDVIGKTVREVVPQIEESWFEIYDRIVLTGVSERFENFAQDVGRFYDVYAFRMGESQEHKVAVLFNDISDRKQAEAAIAVDLRDTQLLRELGTKLITETDIQVLYDEILAAAIALTQADAGTFQFFDNATQELLLLATQGISPTLVQQFNRLNTSCKTSCGIALANGERAFIAFDVPPNKDPDGFMRLHVEAGLLCAQSTPLLSRSGQLIGMVSTHWHTRHQPSDRELRFLDLLARQAADLIEQRQDEAQRKQLLEREQAAREEAERANRIKDEFLAVLSHELRSPLNPILGWAKLLQNGKLDPAKTSQALAAIERNAKLQAELIEDLLDVSRILRGKLSLNVAPVNLAAVIGGAMETVRLAAEAKFIQITANLASDIGAVSGDSTRLQQVVWNLLSNAVKFTSREGQVNIRLERVDSSAQITVSDTGQGIAPAFLPYVFDYFRQADGATTRKFGGLGLGLAIVRHLIELHGGTVWAESPGEGLGAAFSVRLPLMPTPTLDDANLETPSSTPDLTDVQVLVVDDEADSRDFIAFVLEQGGAQVRTATSAINALSLLTQFKPDVLISDIGMPDMDGYMLMQQVRALPAEQGGKIAAIALTAYAGDFNHQQAVKAGFQQHIAKPVEPEQLIEAIVSMLGGR